MASLIRWEGERESASGGRGNGTFQGHGTAHVSAQESKLHPGGGESQWPEQVLEDRVGLASTGRGGCGQILEWFLIHEGSCRNVQVKCISGVKGGFMEKKAGDQNS